MPTEQQGRFQNHCSVENAWQKQHKNSLLTESKESHFYLLEESYGPVIQFLSQTYPFYLLNCVYVYTHVWMQHLQRPGEDTGYPGAGDTGVCKPCDVGAVHNLAS